MGNFDRMITPLKMKNASVPEGLSLPSTSVKELRFHFDEIPLHYVKFRQPLGVSLWK